MKPSSIFTTIITGLLFLSNYSFASDYYIDSVLGVDTNNGTSISTPWKNLSKINGLTLTAGDRLYLKSGSVWNGQQLKFGGSGTASSPIIINQYDSGSKPIINGAGITTANQGVVYLYNQDYIEINNLEITNYPVTSESSINPSSIFFVGLYELNANPLGADRRGVMVALKDKGVSNHIYLKNLEIHHVKGQLGNGSTTVNGAIPKRTGGIYFTVLNESTGSNSRFNDVLIDGCTISYCENTGLALDNEDDVYYPGGDELTLWTARKFTNIKVSNNVIHHIGKNAMIIRCTDETGLIERNVCYETAVGTTGNTMFSARAKGTIFQYNEGYLNRSTTQNIDPGNIDGSMYDADYGSVGIIFQYSYSHDNSEGIYWACNTRGLNNNTTGLPDPEDVGCTLRYCISQNDKGDLIFFNYPSAGNEIYNNVFYTKSGLSPNIIHESGTKNHTYNFYNNIIYDAGSATFSWGSGVGVQTRNFKNNVFYGISIPSQINDTQIISSNPLFVNVGTATTGLNTVTGYKLNSNSPALNNGIVVSNNGGADYFGNLVSNTIAPNRGFFNGSTTLPITLINFKVNQSIDGALLNWQTESEINNQYFAIEKSIDGQIFRVLGTIKGAGNSNHIINYSFIDKNPEKGVNYYRLVQYDFDGKSTISNTVSINYHMDEKDASFSMVLYPNPAKERVNIYLKGAIKYPLLLNIFDLTGHKINSLPIYQFNEPFSLDIQNLNPGIYLLEMINLRNNQILGTSRLIKN